MGGSRIGRLDRCRPKTGVSSGREGPENDREKNKVFILQ